MNFDILLLIVLIACFCVASVGLFKNCIKTFLPKFADKAKAIYPILSYIFGALLGIVFAVEIGKSFYYAIVVGATVGYFSPVIYRLFLKKLFREIGVDLNKKDEDTNS